MSDSKIEVTLTRHSDIHGRGVWLTVWLNSRKRHGLRSRQENAIYTHENSKKILILAEASGGALAEYQNKKYGDRHDPQECAKMAYETALKVIRQIEKEADNPASYSAVLS